MTILAALSLFLVISSGLARPDGPNVEPEYLDHLLATEQYELFAEIMNIPDAKLVRPNEDERNENPMLNKELEMGDILPAFGPLKEESRQGIRFDRYPGSKWPNGYIPYHLNTNDFTQSQRDTINNAINSWNRQVNCLKLRPRTNEADYVYVFSGNGCWSYLGKIGGEQGLSLQRNGCVWTGTVIHEFEHAAGFAHEQNRLDRDNHVEVLWNNIPDEWKSQYEKTNSRDFGLQQSYDYYSIMHYPMKAPGTNNDAFRILANGIDTRRIGNGNDFTETDIRKI
ncbi:M12 family metallopeptidase, partial [Corynebacterium parakroppenstedtii]|uniref:M12 family metallopeptidase n=2 Tax=Corynebacterium parakroppenstedtii TaxID=2828363 RepID=UPI001F2C6819